MTISGVLMVAATTGTVGQQLLVHVMRYVATRLTHLVAPALVLLVEVFVAVGDINPVMVVAMMIWCGVPVFTWIGLIVVERVVGTVVGAKGLQVAFVIGVNALRDETVAFGGAVQETTVAVCGPRRVWTWLVVAHSIATAVVVIVAVVVTVVVVIAVAVVNAVMVFSVVVVVIVVVLGET